MSSCAMCERVLASLSRRGSAGGTEGKGAVWKKDCLTPDCPGACDVRDLNTLLLRCALCSKVGADEGGAGVWKMAAPGAKLLRALLAAKLLVELRCIDWKPSARFVPEEERWKSC